MTDPRDTTPASVRQALAARGMLLHDALQIARTAKVVFESPVTLGATTILSSTAIGAYTYLRGGTIGSMQRIGRFCSVAPGVNIGPGNHPTEFLSTHPFQYGASAFDFWPKFQRFDHGNLRLPREVVKDAPLIGNDVWIGTQCFIARGVSIGNGAVIAAGSVVTRDIPPYAIAAGIPARVLRHRFPDATVERLERLRWWDYEPASLQGVPFDQIDHAIDEIERRIALGTLEQITGKTTVFAGEISPA